MAIATTGVFIYSLIKVNDGPAYFLSMVNSGILATYFFEGVGRVRRRLNGKWL